jgi:hypothetical protein
MAGLVLVGESFQPGAAVAATPTDQQPATEMIVKDLNQTKRFADDSIRKVM